MIRTLIRLGTIKKTYNQFGVNRAQVIILDSENPEDVVLLNPFGFNSSPMPGAMVEVRTIFAHAENTYATPFDPLRTPRLEIGESIVYDAYNNTIHLKKDGTIAIGSKALNITAPTNIISGDLSVTTTGKGIKIAEGVNARLGVAILASGTIVVPNTSVTANSRIFVTPQSVIGSEVGAVRVSAIVPSTSFTITSYRCNNTPIIATNDNSVVAWQIIEGV